MHLAKMFTKRPFGLAVLIIIVLAVYKLAHFSPFEQSIIKRVAVNNLATLYITQASAGATTRYSYRYYLLDASKNEEEVNEFISNEKQQPFLITDDENASAVIKENSIYLKIKGTIYSYQSSAAYSNKIGTFSIPVYLTASPW